MSLRTVFIGMLATLCGLAAAVGVRELSRPDRLTTEEGPQIVVEKAKSVRVVVATQDISRGRVLSKGEIKYRDWPAELVPPGALTRLDDGINRAVLVPLVKGEPVLNGKLAERDSRFGMATLVPDGMRAFTIHTPTIASGVAGFILPGNRVDVLLTMSGAECNGGAMTVTLLQNVEILAVDQRLDAPADNKVDPGELKSTTLLVTPPQAAKLTLAGDKGLLHLSLRNPGDHEPAHTPPISLADLQFMRESPLGTAPAEPVAEELPLLQIRTLRGTHNGALYVRPLPRGATYARARRE